MPIHTDQLGRKVELSAVPTKIVSVVPSQTELLAALGLDQHVAGITKFCVHPSHWFRGKTRVGGTKNLDIPRILSLRPDLIIANKEENVQAQIVALAEHVPVWISDVNSVNSAVDMIRSIGALTATQSAAEQIASVVAADFRRLLADTAAAKRKKTAYLIWQNPFMAAGGDVFISDVMMHAGLDNVFAGNDRYPQIGIEELRRRNTELVLLSSEPYPFREKHVLEFQQSLPGMQVVLVDGEMFSWYGSRMLHAPAYLRDLRKKLD